jgi:hypothetical protein
MALPFLFTALKITVSSLVVLYKRTTRFFLLKIDLPAFRYMASPPLFRPAAARCCRPAVYRWAVPREFEEIVRSVCVFEAGTEVTGKRVSVVLCTCQENAVTLFQWVKNFSCLMSRCGV